MCLVTEFKHFAASCRVQALPAVPILLRPKHLSNLRVQSGHLLSTIAVWGDASLLLLTTATYTLYDKILFRNRSLLKSDARRQLSNVSRHVAAVLLPIHDLSDCRHV